MPLDTNSSKSNENIFGNRLRILRNSMQQTQKEFSDLLGLVQSSLSAYESGKNKPTIDVVIHIADTCNVSVDWLCGRDSKSSISALSDVARFFFELYEAKELSCMTTIHDRVDREDVNDTDDENRNWVQIKYYHNDVKIHPEHKYNQDICDIIKKVSELHSELTHYDCSQGYYNSEKEKYIAYCSDIPITKIDFSDMTEEERRQRRMDLLKSELENQTY